MISRRTVAAAFAPAVLLLAACGGSTSAESSTPASAAPSATASLSELDVAFLAKLSPDFPVADDAGKLASGVMVCKLFLQGADRPVVVKEMKKVGLDSAAANEVINAAVPIYCPQFEAAL